MEAVCGVGSLRSGGRASALGRELEELGAWWHGLDWSTRALIEPGDEYAAGGIRRLAVSRGARRRLGPAFVEVADIATGRLASACRA